MKPTRLFYPLIFPIVVLVFSILACRKPVPVADTMPVFPQATEIPPGTDTFADFLLERMQPITPTATFTVTGKVYTVPVPTDTTWAEVQSFYDEALGEEWSVLPLEYPELKEISVEGIHIHMADWLNKDFPSLQMRFHIMLAISPDVDEAFLVTALYHQTTDN